MRRETTTSQGFASGPLSAIRCLPAKRLFQVTSSLASPARAYTAMASRSFGESSKSEAGAFANRNLQPAGEPLRTFYLSPPESTSDPCFLLFRRAASKGSHILPGADFLRTFQGFCQKTAMLW